MQVAGALVAGASYWEQIKLNYGGGGGGGAAFHHAEPGTLALLRRGGGTVEYAKCESARHHRIRAKIVLTYFAPNKNVKKTNKNNTGCTSPERPILRLIRG